MSNTDRATGFKPANAKDAVMQEYRITSGQATKCGDVLRMGTSGYVRGSSSGNTLPAVGIQASEIYTKPTQGITEQKSTADANSYVKVWDNPNEVFEGQISSFSYNDPYVTRISSLCYDEDVSASAGQQEINASASALDTFKVVGLASEENGQRSTTGANAKVRCRFNPSKHLYGSFGLAGST